ncbi:MAG: ABC transporter ATP-binding protein [Deltaproteobacteria bacterium HGW-Deltaproteobacteria-22]|nr:MAG: ABC transporter ATP-binding protein [Deltaproteobacteria bacterium HGW-Deltaproteobacteria-22]
MEKKKIYLELRDLSKIYIDGVSQNRVILDNVNQSFLEGEITSIVGKSGSGKSTLLNLISGIDSITNGSIFLYGKDISKMADRELTTLRRNEIGFIFQFFNLLPTLSVWENVCLPLELKYRSSRQDFSRAEFFLKEVDMYDRKNEFPDKLSGGEQQRVAIARALVHQPSLILADEPTGNLDEKNANLIMNLLAKLAKDNQNNLILVTHSREAAKFSDRILTLTNGLLVPFVE